MPEMKESGIEWVGKIPEKWKVSKIKYHLMRNERRNPGNVQVLSVYREYGIIPKDSRDDNHNVTSEDTSKYKYVKPGVLVINKMKAWQGSMGVSEYEGIVSPAYFVYEFTSGCVSAKYLHYLLRNVYKEEFRRISGGIREGQWDLPSIGFENEYIPIPSLIEQIHIADFLDSKCTEIDVLTADIQKEIDVLEEYKCSIVTEAVTKGINPNVLMKDSGIEWIGEIPQNWEMVSFQHILKERSEKNYPIKTDERLSLSIDKGVTLYADKTTNLDRFKEDVSQYKLAHPGDLIMNSMNMIVGAVGISDYYGCVSPAYYVFYDEDGITARFCDYIFQNNMEKATYKKEVFIAVTLLLCLWFKLDALIEYGLENVSYFCITSSVLLLLLVLSIASWLLLTNRKKLWAILVGIFKSRTFDTISWIAFLMPIICIDEFRIHFACTSWVLGDLMLLGAFWISQKHISENDIYERL